MGKNVDEPQSSEELAQIARDLYGNTDPLRQNLIGRSMQFLGMDPYSIMNPNPKQGQPEIIGYSEPDGNNRNMREPIYGPAPEVNQSLFNADYLPTQATGVEASPLFAALKQATEDQYGVARDNILASTPAGGALTSGLVDLETARARDMTGNIARLYQDEMNRALGFATGSPVQAMQGLGQAGNIQANMALANAQQNAATKSALGAGAGAYFGGKA